MVPSGTIPTTPKRARKGAFFFCFFACHMTLDILGVLYSGTRDVKRAAQPNPGVSVNHVKGILVAAAISYVVLMLAQSGSLPGIDLTKTKAKSA